MAVPTRADVLSLLPASAAVQPSSLVDRVDSATGLLYLRGHGLTEGDELELELVDDTTAGAEATSLPGTLAEGTTYEAVPATAGSFRLRLPDAATITSFADSGVGRFRILPDPWDDLDAQIGRSYRYILSQCIAHGGDITSGVVTDMATAHAAGAYAAAKAAGDPEASASYEPALRVWKEDYAPYLERLFAGAPVKGAVDATPAAEQGARLVSLGGGYFDGTGEFERV